MIFTVASRLTGTNLCLAIVGAILFIIATVIAIVLAGVDIDTRKGKILYLEKSHFCHD